MTWAAYDFFLPHLHPSHQEISLEYASLSSQLYHLLRILPNPRQTSPPPCSRLQAQVEWVIPSACFHDTQDTLLKPLCVCSSRASEQFEEKEAAFICSQCPAQCLPIVDTTMVDGWMGKGKDHAYEVFEMRYFNSAHFSSDPSSHT